MDSPFEGRPGIYERYDANAFCIGKAFTGNPVAAAVLRYFSRG